MIVQTSSIRKQKFTFPFLNRRLLYGGHTTRPYMPLRIRTVARTRVRPVGKVKIYSGRMFKKVKKYVYS